MQWSLVLILVSLQGEVHTEHLSFQTEAACVRAAEMLAQLGWRNYPQERRHYGEDAPLQRSWTLHHVCVDTGAAGSRVLGRE